MINVQHIQMQLEFMGQKFSSAIRVHADEVIENLDGTIKAAVESFNWDLAVTEAIHRTLRESVGWSMNNEIKKFVQKKVTDALESAFKENDDES